MCGIKEKNKIKGISLNDQGDIMIGIRTPLFQLVYHPIVKEYIPILGLAIEQITEVPIRKKGTIEECLNNYERSADIMVVLCALKAYFRGMTINGEQIVSLDMFDLSIKDATLTHLIIKKDSYQDYQGYYMKYMVRHKQGHLVLGSSIVCKLGNAKDYMDDLRIVFAVAGAKPYCFQEVAIKVQGGVINDQLYESVVRYVEAEIIEHEVFLGSEKVELQIVGEVVKYTLKEAIRLTKKSRD